MVRGWWLGVLCLAACADGNLARQAARPPEFKPEGQSKCGVLKGQSRPLVVEWPSADRAALEAQSRRGFVAVRYEGCEMELLRQCTVPGRYGYTAITRKRDHVIIRDTDDLYAKVPMGAARLEGKLAKAGMIDVAMTIVGTFDADKPPARLSDAHGDCSRATHLVSSFTVGAFQFHAGAEAEVGASAGVAGVSVDGRSRSQRELLNQDGDELACGRASGGDTAPPEGCGAFLRVEVIPVLAPGAPAIAAAGGDLVDALRKAEQAREDADDRAALAAREGTRLVAHLGSGFLSSETRLPNEHAAELPAFPAESTPRSMDLMGARLALAIGIRRMLSARWDLQGRVGFGLALGEQVDIEGFDSSTGRSAVVSDTSVLAMPVDLSARFRPSGRGFFLGLGPSLELQHWSVRFQSQSNGSRLADHDVGETVAVFGAVMEIGVVFGTREAFELSLRARAHGAQSRINPTLDFSLAFGWAAL